MNLRGYRLDRPPFGFKKLRYIIWIECICLLLFVLSGFDADNWKAAAYSYIPISLTLTSFLHFGFKHLFSNMLVMFMFGWPLCHCMSERKAKGLTLPLLFIIASFVTGVATYYLEPHSYTAGASGTVMALEAYVFVTAIAGGSDPLSLMLRQHKIWLVVNAAVSVLCLFNFDKDVSFTGHFSGAVAGAVVAYTDLRIRKLIKKLNDRRIIKQSGARSSLSERF